MSITTIVFDLDETLMYEDRSVAETRWAVGETVRKRFGVDAGEFADTTAKEAEAIWREKCPVRPYCLDIGISSSEGLAGAFTGEDPNLKVLREWIPDYRHETWRNALLIHKVEDDDFAEKISELFMEERRNRHIVFPETEATLMELQSTYRIGLLTNGAPDVQREKMDAAGLGHYFEVVGISGEIGTGKPGLRAFTHTLDKFGIPPEKAVMVGDHPVNDIQGGQRAGIKGIWVNRCNQECDETITPYGEIRDLDELAGEITRIQNSE
ncbi:MAG: HAD family hydrolase [Gemmatimonadota bacterium]|nr:HAD family hydrolase [Gemmatimonadota bacterium]